MPSTFTSSFASTGAASAPRPNFHDEAKRMAEDKARQQPKERARPQRVRFQHSAMGAWEPVSSIMLAGRQPALYTCGFIPDPEEGESPMPGQPLGMDSEPPKLSNDGWRAFVRLVENLIRESPKNTWVTGESIEGSRHGSLLSEFDTVYRQGELKVALAVFKGKVPVLLTDRGFYYIDPVKAQRVGWEHFETYVGAASEAEKHIEVRLRDARRIYINLGGAIRTMAEPLAEFINEVSFLFEPEGTPMVVISPDTVAADLVVPPVCCGCMSEEVGQSGGVAVRDPADPVLIEEGEERKGITTIFGKKQKEQQTAFGTVHFRRCAFCDWNDPVRIASVAGGMRVMIFRNGYYAQRFHDDNVRHFSEEGHI
jgi:hypothetical protein